MTEDLQGNTAREIGDQNSLANVPFAILRAELVRRQDGVAKPTCGTAGERGHYNTPLHVIALVLILALSTLACAFPIIARRFPKLPIPHHFLFLSRHFGTGVLIATAFVHLLPTAFVSLTDPCLPSFWNKGYPAMAGLIAMAAVMMVVSIEMFFATKGAGHSHGSEYDTLPLDTEGTHHGHRGNGHARPPHPRKESLKPFRQGKIGADPETHGIGLHPMSGSSERLVNGSAQSSKDHNDDDEDIDDPDLDLEEPDPYTDESAHLTSPNQTSHEYHRPRSHSHHHEDHQTSEPNPQKLLLQCLLLEAGILFHSIFIGMALSVATGTSFIVLLVAISFHQTFEGLALGSRISALPQFGPSSPKPWLMALAYGTTTPIGQAIGLGMHNLYDPASVVGLLMVGVTNAISSGLLLFAGLVQLLAEDFLSDRSYEVLNGRRRVEACISVAVGALLMALVGAWA